MTQLELHTTTFTTTRFSTELPGTFADAVHAFEREVPALSVPELLAVIARHHNWDDVLAWTDEHAPWGFLIYWRNEVGPVMSVAGDSAQCISYLMGNHTIAETMFRHDARVMNYAPLRVEITQEPNGAVLFTTEIPSHQFASFDHPAIAEVGTLLDDKLARLLQRLGARLPISSATAGTAGNLTPAHPTMRPDCHNRKENRMPDAAPPAPDLAGTADERLRELGELAATRTLGAEWLKRQLDAVLLAWANDETKLDIDTESHIDY